MRWFYVYELPPDPATGKRRRQWSRGMATKAAAERAPRDELARHDSGLRGDPSRLTVAGLADRWLQLRDLAPLHLLDLYQSLGRRRRPPRRPPGGLSPRTIRAVHKTLHRMLHDAVRLRLLAINPAADLKLPYRVVEPQIVTLEPDQARRLLEVAASPGRAGWWPPLILLAVATGARRGELLALRWADVDLDAGSVRIGRTVRRGEHGLRVKEPKTDAGRRTVGLAPTAIAQLRGHRTEQLALRLAYGAGDDLIVCKPDGAPLSPEHVSSEFRRLAARAGLPASVHLHTLRHSAASFLAAAGVPASDIAAQLGHADGGAPALRMYVHPLEEGRRRAAAVLDQVIEGS